MAEPGPVKLLYPVIGVEVEQEAFQFRHSALGGDEDPGKPVDGLNPVPHSLEFLLADQVGFVENDNIGM